MNPKAEMPRHAPRRRVHGEIEARTKTKESCEVDVVTVGDDGGGDDERRGAEAGRHRLLPRLAQANQRGGSECATRINEPRWMECGNSHGGDSKAEAEAMRRKKPTRIKARPHELSLLDEQMLILCRSAMQQSWRSTIEESSAQYHSSPKKPVKYGHESIYAATQVQRLFRGFKTRRWLAKADGPRFQRAASHIQFALRRVLVARRVLKRWIGKRHRSATRIQAWYRGQLCRDRLQCEQAGRVVEGVTMLQRRFRGYRFWNLVATLLLQHRNNAATQIQRLYRGLAARRRVQRLRLERLRFANELKEMSAVHRRQARCRGCKPDQATEGSLFACFMTRFIGLHDFAGAKTLGLEGLQKFATSARFCFMYSVLLQATGDALDVSMTYLHRAQLVLKLCDDDVLECERRYLFPALQLCTDDIAVLLDLAVVSQSCGKLSRAESFYRIALEQPPLDYAVPGYWHRVGMVDRLLLNYHRFCSVFNSRQVNVLAKAVPIAKRGEQVRLMVARFNQFTVISPTEEENKCRFNAVYLSDEEVSRLFAEQDGEEGSPTPTPFASRGLNASYSHTSRASVRRSSKFSRGETSKGVALKEEAAQAFKNVVVQAYQSEFRGLRFKLKELSSLSEKRSKIQLTRELADRLLRELAFLDPTSDVQGESQDSQRIRARDAASVYRAVMVPSVFKTRILRSQDVCWSHAIVNVQRVFRGFRVRARMRREALLQRIQQRQVDELYAKLHRNFVFREKRRIAATAIQRIYKGFAVRQALAEWQLCAITVQRVYRGHRGRKRAVAFREGNLTFYMSERVFQRGVSISGRFVMLIIEKCGLSFRLEAYDMIGCTMYPGFVAHESTMALLRYENWSYAQRLCEREVFLHGRRATIKKVKRIGRSDAQCVVSCQIDEDTETHSLTDCIHAINLRNAGTKGMEAEQLLPPLTVDDTARIVSCLVGKLALIPAIPMATKELHKKTPGSLILAVMPPPHMHYVFIKTGSVHVKLSNHTTVRSTTATEASVPTALLRQVTFPVVDGLRGTSVGRKQFRKKCLRHSVQFTKCRVP